MEETKGWLQKDAVEEEGEYKRAKKMKRGELDGKRQVSGMVRTRRLAKN